MGSVSWSGLNSNQIVIANPMILWAHCYTSISCRYVTIVYGSICVWGGIYLSPLVGTSFSCPCSVSYIGIVFSNGALPSVFKVQSKVLAIPCLFQSSYGAPSANNSFKCYPLHALKVSFGSQRCLIGALSPLLFDNSNLYFFHICIYLMSFNYIGLLYIHQNFPSFQLSLILPLLPCNSPSPFDPPIPSPCLQFVSIHNYVLYFPFLRGVSPLFLVFYFMPNLCGYTDYKLLIKDLRDIVI